MADIPEYILALLAGILQAMAGKKTQEREWGRESAMAGEDWQRQMMKMAEQSRLTGERQTTLRGIPQARSPTLEMKDLMGIGQMAGAPEITPPMSSDPGQLAQLLGIGAPMIGPMQKGVERPMRIPIEQPPTPEEKQREELTTYKEKKKIDVEYAGKKEKLIQGIRVQYKGKKPDKVDVQVWSAARKQAEGEAKKEAYDKYVESRGGTPPTFAAEVPPVKVTVKRVMEIYNEMMGRMRTQPSKATTPTAGKASVFDDLATFIKTMLTGEKEPPR